MTHPLHGFAAALLLGGCTSPPAPRPGTQIGVEESGGCEDDVVVPVGDPNVVPEGGEQTFEDALVGILGRFVGTTSGGEVLTLTVDGARDEAKWVQRRPLGPEGRPESCPPLWRVPMEAAVYTTDVAWDAEGTLSLGSEEATAWAEGPANVDGATPTDVDPVATQLFAGWRGGIYTVLLVWTGDRGAEGEPNDEELLRGTVEAAP